jgi:hypothetical protein
MGLRAKLDKDYNELVKHNKIYEQFADTFATSYGFGGSSSKFYTGIQTLIKDYNAPKHLAILNYIPILSTLEASRRMVQTSINVNVNGYDESYVRIAQVYRTLEFELVNNKDLTPAMRKEITEHMETVKADYELFNKMETANFSTNPSITKWIMKKYRNGTITEVADASGIVEGVLEVIKEYERTGTVKEPPIVKRIDLKASEPSKKVDNFISNFANSFASTIVDIKSQLGFNKL